MRHRGRQSILAGLFMAAPGLARAEIVLVQRRQEDFTFQPDQGAGGRGRQAHHRADRPGGTGAPAGRHAQGRARSPNRRPPEAARSRGRRRLRRCPPPASTYAWFWDTVPPAIRLRFRAAFRWPWPTLSQGPGGSSVARPAHAAACRRSPQTYGTDILKATIGTEVSPALVLAVIGIESAGQADAVSSAGAQGLMQLIPATAERFGVDRCHGPGAEHQGRGGLSGLADEEVRPRSADGAGRL